MSDKAITEKIDFSKSEQYTLSIRLSTDGFSFSIYNPLDNQFYFIPVLINPSLSLAVNVKEMIQRNSALNYSFKRVNLLQVGNRFTLIPNELFEEESGEGFYQYNQQHQDNEKILYNTLYKTDMIVAFSIDKSIYQQFKETFPDINFHSQSSLLIEYFSTKSRLGNSKKMYVYISNNSIDIFCYEKGKLLFANSFKCAYTEDRIYYLLYVWKQLNYDQERDEMHLVGFFEDKENLTTKLRKYIRQVFIINPKSEFNNSWESGMENVPFDMQILSQNEF